MTSYTTPAKVRWARSAISGDKPTIIAEGSMAVNWADRKIYVGDPGGQPTRFTQWIEDWTSIRRYDAGDYVTRDGDLLRALKDIFAGNVYDPDEWELIGNRTLQAATGTRSTDVIRGGVVTKTADTVVSIAEGVGVIVDNSSQETFSTTLVAWTSYAVELSDTGPQWEVLAMDSDGVLFSQSADTFTNEMRRDNVVLATVQWLNGTISTVIDSSVRTGGTAETYKDEYYANGGAYRLAGLVASAKEDTLGLAFSEGTVFSIEAQWRVAPKNPNIIPVAAIAAPATLSLITPRGVESIGTAVDPNYWDNGSSVAAVPQGRFTIQYISATPDFSSISVQYGQSVYSDLSLASNALDQDWATSTRAAPTVYTVSVAALIVQEGVPDLNNAVLVPAIKGVAPYPDQGIVPDTEGFYPLDGSRPLEGDMDVAGFELRDATIDAGEMNAVDQSSVMLIERSTTTGEFPASAAAARYGEVSVNMADRKLYVRDPSGAAALISSPVADFRDDLAYRAGDLCISDDNTLQVARNDNGPGAYTQADWRPISASTAGSNMVTLSPTEPGRNTIVTEINTEALVLQGQQLQSAPLMEVPGTEASNTTSATIDRYGYPVGNFAPQMTRISVPSHEFSSRGEAAEYSSGNGWRLARFGSVVSGFVAHIIDANTVVIRTNGLLDDLQNSALALGSFAAGTEYYLSDGSNGKLTPTAPNPGAVPILRTTTTTQGVLFPVNSTSIAIGDYVLTTGDTMTGDLVINAPTGSVVLVDNSYAQVNDRRVQLRQSTDEFQLRRQNDIGSATSTFMRAKPGDFRVYNSSGAATMEVINGDTSISGDFVAAGTIDAFGSYLALNSDGDKSLAFRNGSASLQGEFRWSQSGGRFDFYAGGTLIGRLDPSGTVAGNALTVLTRQQGDARYELKGTPKTGLQAGVAIVDSSSRISVTFKEPFSSVPVVTLTAESDTDLSDRLASAYFRKQAGDTVTTTGFTATSRWTSPSTNGNNQNNRVFWMAIEAT